MWLIEVDAFVKSINESIAEAHKWGANAQTDEIRIRAEQAIATFCEASLRARQMPEVDAVPVVRCWECELWNEWDYSGHKELGNFVCSCAHWTNEDGYVVYTKPDDFCSYGERKDGDA